MVRLSLALAVMLAICAAGSSGHAQRRYTVRRGDTLVRIAQRFDVGLRALRRANRLRNNTIRPGETLRIPGRSGRRRQARASRRGRRGSRSGVHRVRRGDTLSGIARRYDVSVRRLRRANRLRGNVIRPGDKLRVPGRGMGRQRPEGRRPDELTDAQKRALKRAEKLGLGSSRTAHRLLIKPPNPEWVKAAARRTDEGPLQTLTPPVEDPTILRGWGSGPGGYHLAVDVGGKPGTEVQAAAPGMVAYAGSQVRGYGNAVIVVHANGWVTWYTHNRQNLVVPGQSVKAGEPIARMGQTGYAHGAHLHFMLVYEGEHCDPMPLLRTDAPLEDRSGDPVEVDPARWQDERPDGVRCLPKSARPHPGRAKRRRGR